MRVTEMLIVRKATPTDATVLAGFLAECAVGHPAQGTTPDAAWIRDVMLGDPSICRVLIAEHGATPIGFASWRPTYDYLFGIRGAEVVWLFIQPSYRGVGVAAVLLAQVCADVLKDGGAFLWGAYREAHVGKFYERMVRSQPETWVGLSSEDVEFLAKLAGQGPRAIARAMRERTSDGPRG